ncbi:MAG TPA: DUF3800 domain-containing protein [Alphaproteobacteria bacterium]|jgi:hypothetical protein|nr:DUF3800 domain-containing protein [Alphaproteobacteria bacterium]
MITIFIDESGTLPDTKDKVIVIAAVGVFIPSKIDKIFKALQKKRDSKTKARELKFYTAGNKTKDLFFEKIAKEDFEIFVLEVEKMNRKIPDTPENFAVLCWILLNDILTFCPNIKEVILDRHFSRDYDTKQFNKFLHELLPNHPQISHVDSKFENRVNIADMIAGAVLSKEAGKTDKYFNIITSKIISEKRLNWTEAKKKFLNKKLV